VQELVELERGPTRARRRAGRASRRSRHRSSGRGSRRSSRGRNRWSAGCGSAGRRGTGCGARSGAARRRRRRVARRFARGISPPAASLSSAFRVERVRISGNCRRARRSSSWTMNSISRIPPRESLTSLARSGRPAARRCASSRTFRCSWRRPSKTP
jgi:hypothetical protein